MTTAGSDPEGGFATRSPTIALPLMIDFEFRISAETLQLPPAGQSIPVELALAVSVK
jgi:hypothetical protein